MEDGVTVRDRTSGACPQHTVDTPTHTANARRQLIILSGPILSTNQDVTTHCLYVN